MKRFFIASLLLATLTSVTAQQNNKRPNYKLLWKISGNGLKKPSYLFGTMHVQDNRAFDFSDSVLLKISECEAFALEFHPDSVTRFVLAMYLGNQTDKKNNFKDLLSEKEYARLDSLMIKRTGLSLNKFTEPSRAKYFLQNQATKKHKRTFLDAWLYRIAREQNKIMIGLEDSRTQLQMLASEPAQDIELLIKYLESNEEALINPHEALLDIYHRGDIDEIRKTVIAVSGQAEYEHMITKRNVVMADNIKKEIHIHSTFIGVGAAHLPGEEGIISLLKNDGYTVSLIQPRFTGLAAKYKYASGEAKWATYTSDDGGYVVEMPQQPVEFKPGTIPMTFQTYFDMGVPSIYMAAHFTVGPEFTGQPSSMVLDALEKNMRRQNKPEASSKIKVQGYEGRVMNFANGDGQYFKVQLVHRENVVYMLMAGPSREFTRSADANKFFSSFGVIPFEQKNATNFENKAGAFSVNMPGHVDSRVLNPRDAQTGARYTLNLFHTINTASGESFLVRYNDFPPGFISSDDSIYYATMVQSIMMPMNGTNLSNRDIEIQGFKGHAFSFNAGPSGMVHGRMVLRGNRYYLALATTSALNASKASEDFLNSLRFNPYQPTKVKQMDFAEGITLTVPDNFTLDSATLVKENGQTRYNILDNNSGMTFILTIETLSKYQEEKDGHKFLEKMLDLGLAKTDSVISRKSSTDEHYLAYQADVVSTRINAIKRIKVIAAGENVFTLWGYLPADYQGSDFPDKFFNSLKIKNKSQWNLLSDKTDIILEHILSSDSLTQAEAEAAIVEHTFEKNDLPKVYKAISKTYSDDDQLYGSTKTKLLGVLKRTNDESTLEFIKTIYYKLPDSTQLRDHALSVLTALKTDKAASEMLRLFKEDVSKKNFNGYLLLNSFHDSLSMLNNILPEFLLHESRFSNTYPLFSLAKEALDSGALNTDAKAKVISQIMATAKSITGDFAKAKKDDDSYERLLNRLEDLSNLLTAVPFSPEIKDMMMILLNSGDIPTMMITSIHLLKNNITFDQAYIDKIAADPLRRFQFYDDMKKINKERLIDARYLTSRMMAESDLYEYMDYDDGAPEVMEFLKERKVFHEGQKKTIHIFKFKYYGDDTWYIGISGPYDTQSKEGPTRGEFTATFYDAYESTKQLEELLTKFLADYGAKLVK